MRFAVGIQHIVDRRIAIGVNHDLAAGLVDLQYPTGQILTGEAWESAVSLVAMERRVVVLAEKSGIALNRPVREFLDPADLDLAAG
ncbi:hypothetical protein D3C85_1213850 [compost metagenome]